MTNTPTSTSATSTQTIWSNSSTPEYDLTDNGNQVAIITNASAQKTPIRRGHKKSTAQAQMSTGATAPLTPIQTSKGCNLQLQPQCINTSPTSSRLALGLELDLDVNTNSARFSEDFSDMVNRFGLLDHTYDRVHLPLSLPTNLKANPSWKEHEDAEADEVQQPKPRNARFSRSVCGNRAHSRQSASLSPIQEDIFAESQYEGQHHLQPQYQNCQTGGPKALLSDFLVDDLPSRNSRSSTNGSDDDDNTRTCIRRDTGQRFLIKRRLLPISSSLFNSKPADSNPQAKRNTIVDSNWWLERDILERVNEYAQENGERRGKNKNVTAHAHSSGSLSVSLIQKLRWTFESGDSVYIVLDYHGEATLQDLITHCGPLALHCAIFYAAELVSALSSLHKIGITHNAVEPRNIALDKNGHIVVTNFSRGMFSPDSRHEREHDYTKGRNRVTECQYQAPEVFLGWKTDSKADCWSFGMVVFFMFFGTHPYGLNEYTQEDPAQWFADRVIGNPILMESLRLVHPLARDLIGKCLERNPSLRCNMESIKEHEYFALIDWQDVADKRLDVPILARSTVELWQTKAVGGRGAVQRRPLSLSPSATRYSDSTETRRSVSTATTTTTKSYISALDSTAPVLPELFISNTSTGMGFLEMTVPGIVPDIEEEQGEGGEDEEGRKEPAQSTSTSASAGHGRGHHPRPVSCLFSHPRNNRGDLDVLKDDDNENENEIIEEPVIKPLIITKGHDIVLDSQDRMSRLWAEIDAEQQQRHRRRQIAGCGGPMDIGQSATSFELLENLSGLGFGSVLSWPISKKRLFKTVTSVRVKTQKLRASSRGLFGFGMNLSTSSSFQLRLRRDRKGRVRSEEGIGPASGAAVEDGIFEISSGNSGITAYASGSTNIVSGTSNSSSMHTAIQRQCRNHIHDPLSTIKNLPLGLHQIGSGIGFTYNVPAAHASKATLSGCSLTSASESVRTYTPGCHRILRLRESFGFGFGRGNGGLGIGMGGVDGSSGDDHDDDGGGGGGDDSKPLAILKSRSASVSQFLAPPLTTPASVIMAGNSEVDHGLIINSSNPSMDYLGFLPPSGTLKDMATPSKPQDGRAGGKARGFGRTKRGREIGNATFLRDMYECPSWILSPPESVPLPMALVSPDSSSGSPMRDSPISGDGIARSSASGVGSTPGTGFGSGEVSCIGSFGFGYNSIFARAPSPPFVSGSSIPGSEPLTPATLVECVGCVERDPISHERNQGELGRGFEHEHDAVGVAETGEVNISIPKALGLELELDFELWAPDATLRLVPPASLIQDKDENMYESCGIEETRVRTSY